ncbi:hypothetical protein INT45_000701 [Circinella minor]|uniref:Uncharacterized protein n=1 Tax=Circinella minor TaxID=1195481 RepID=A0A8H7VF90_9FUNG|nr:hypothetical protein INT45_000701 [Circinella minor]
MKDLIPADDPGLIVRFLQQQVDMVRQTLDKLHPSLKFSKTTYLFPNVCRPPAKIDTGRQPSEKIRLGRKFLKDIEAYLQAYGLDFEQHWCRLIQLIRDPNQRAQLLTTPPISLLSEWS